MSLALPVSSYLTDELLKKLDCKEQVQAAAQRMKCGIRFVSLVLVLLVVSSRASAQDRIISLAGRRVAVWEGRGTGTTPAPVLVMVGNLGPSR